MIALLTASVGARAETRALLVGAWKFETAVILDLKGPENDLGAMEALVRAEGATDVTVLRNDQVTRTTVETALHALGLRAKPGDWIVFYYSGHGAQAEAAVKGTRDGNLDQFVPLPKFDPDTADAERYIVDKDFYAWLSRYIPKSVQVLMIADVCHSGTLNRSIDRRAFHFTPRLAFRGDAAEIQLAARPAPRFPSVLDASVAADTGALDRADLPNLVYVAAAQDAQLALEAPLPVEGAPSRGLLTYAFEQGLTTFGADGKTLAADLDGDGKVAVGEIATYLDAQVRALSSERQEPRTAFVTGREAGALFATVPPAPAVPAGPPLPTVFANDAAMAAALATPDQPFRAAAAAAQADFVWDVAKAAVVRRSGDQVAQAVTTVAALRGVVEKWNAVAALRPLLDESRARVSIGPAPAGSRYAAGAQVDLTLTARASAAGYATVFDIAADGTVQTLFPLKANGDGDGALAAIAQRPVLETRVVAPFGADHVVAVVTPQPPAALRALLRTVEGQRASGRLVAPIRDALAAGGAGAGLSIGELYTGS